VYENAIILAVILILCHLQL